MSGNENSGLFVLYLQNVRQEDIDRRPTNTKRAYDSKELEWFAYYDHLFAKRRMLGPCALYAVTKEKFFGFLYYQTRRDQKKKGQKGKPLEGFNAQQFEHYMADPTRFLSKPVGYSCVNQYRLAIMKIHQDQVSQGANNSPKQMLMSN